MRINGSFGLYESYNSMHTRDIPQISVEEAKEQMQQTKQQNALTSEIPALQNPAEPAEKASKIADLDNISLSFNKEDDYGYIGRDSSLVQLDIEKALSDMKKDSVLEEYQFFVGSAGALGKPQVSEDGIVIPKFFV